MLCECIIKQDYSYWGQALVSVFSLIVLLCIFPYPDPVNKSDNSRETVISALSLGSKNGKNVLNWSNIDLLIKPFAPQAIKNEFGENAECTLKNLYIIPSNDLKNSLIDDDVLKYLNDEICKKYIEKYNKDQNLNDLSQLIHQIINQLYGKEISVCIYDEPVDYNSFDSVKKAVVKVLQKDDFKDGSKVYLYISPGTKFPTAVLSLVSVVGGRRILYADQKEGNQIISICLDYKTIDQWMDQLNSDQIQLSI